MGGVRILEWLAPAVPVEAVDWDAVYREEMPRVFNYFRYRGLRAGHGRGPDLGHLREGLAGAGPVPPGAGRRLDLAPRDRPQRRDRPLPALAPRSAARGRRGPRRGDAGDGRPCARRSPVGSPRCSRALPERERELLALKYGADATNRAIATLTGLSESNVGTILHRTVVSLRARWDEGGPQ